MRHYVASATRCRKFIFVKKLCKRGKSKQACVGRFACTGVGWDTASACSEHDLVATCVLIVFVVASFQCVNLLQLCVPGFCLAADKFLFAVLASLLLSSAAMPWTLNVQSAPPLPRGGVPVPKRRCSSVRLPSGGIAVPPPRVVCCPYGAAIPHQKPLVPSCAPTAATGYGPSRSSGASSLRQGCSAIF